MSLQSQIDAGGTVILPAGDVILREPLRLWRSVRLVSAGITRLIPSAPGQLHPEGPWNAPASGLVLITGEDILIEDVTADGCAAGLPTAAIYGFEIRGAERVILSRCQGHYCPGSTPEGGVGGDGLVIHPDSARNGKHPYDITVRDFIARGNVRQGISICAGRRMYLSNIQTSHTSGSDPGAGIDLEPYSTSQVLSDVRIESWVSYANRYGLLISNPYEANISRITIRGHCMSNRLYNVQVAGKVGLIADIVTE